MSQGPAKAPAKQPTGKPGQVSRPTPDDEEDLEEEGSSRGGLSWMLESTPSWLASLLIHMLALILAALIFGGKIIVEKIIDAAPKFEAAKVEQLEQAEVERFELKNPQYDPGELTTESLTLTQDEPIAQTAQYNDASPVFEERGGGVAGGVETGAGMGLDIKATGLGPAARGGGGVDTGLGTGKNAGRGGDGTGFGGRGSGSREEMVGKYGGTKATERAVGAALNWIARHQANDGRWTLDHRSHCKDASCTGEGSHKSDPAATAMGLLPFLAAGQTHQSKGPYQRNITGGVAYLLKNQKPTGDYSGENYMYAHGLCTIAMSEAFGMTGDSRLRDSVMAAVRYIEAGQDPETGGWWYQHMQRGGDTSVVGWQVMGLKSAQMAGVQVKPGAFQGIEKWYGIVGKGQYKGQFSYRPESPASPNMTAVGLLCIQYMGAPRGDPRVQEGSRLLMQGLPNPGNTNFYYWYYGTQVMHNMPGPDWDTWNRAMRKVLVDLQDKNGCATGSWDPAKEPFGKQGGRLFVTALGALTLEVYYRYLPLYKLDGKDDLNKLKGKEEKK